MPGNPVNFNIAPSDLTFLYSECARCFYEKVRLGLRRPSMPMPSVFTRMDAQQKAYLNGRSTSELSSSLGPGVLMPGRWVQSRPIAVPGHSATCAFRGCIDTILAFDN